MGHWKSCGAGPHTQHSIKRCAIFSPPPYLLPFVKQPCSYPFLIREVQLHAGSVQGVLWQPDSIRELVLFANKSNSSNSPLIDYSSFTDLWPLLSSQLFLPSPPNYSWKLPRWVGHFALSMPKTTFQGWKATIFQYSSIQVSAKAEPKRNGHICTQNMSHGQFLKKIFHILFFKHILQCQTSWSTEVALQDRPCMFWELLSFFQPDEFNMEGGGLELSFYLRFLATNLQSWRWVNICIGWYILFSSPSLFVGLSEADVFVRDAPEWLRGSGCASRSGRLL